MNSNQSLRKIQSRQRLRGRSLVKAFLLVFFSLLRFSPAQGEELFRCDLETCINAALSNHPALKAGEAREASAQALLEMREAERRPALGLNLDLGHFSGESVSPFAAVSGLTEESLRQQSVSGEYYQGVVGLEIPIFKEGTLLGGTSSSVREAAFGLSEKAWMNRSLRTVVALGVTETYVQIFKSQKAVEIHQEIVAASEADYNLAKTKFGQNLISKNDLLTAEVRWEIAKRDLLRARLSLQRGRKALVSWTGVGKGGEIKIAGLPVLPVLSREEAAARVQQNHPEIRARQFRVKEAEEQIARAEKEQYPTLSLAAHYGFADDFDRPINDQWIAAFKVEVPILDFGLGSKKVALARARATEEEQELLHFRRKVEEEVDEIYLGLEELDHQAVLIGKQIEQATEALKLNRAMSQQNLLPSSVVRDSEAALLKLKLAQTEVNAERTLALLRLWWIDGYGGSKSNVSF
jgi:outer membrane protein TolC